MKTSLLISETEDREKKELHIIAVVKNPLLFKAKIIQDLNI